MGHRWATLEEQLPANKNKWEAPGVENGPAHFENPKLHALLDQNLQRSKNLPMLSTAV